MVRAATLVCSFTALAASSTANGAAAAVSPLLNSSVLDPVPAGEVRVGLGLGQVVGPGVHGAVEIGEELGDGLELLVAVAAGGVDGLGLRQVAGGDGVGQQLGLVDGGGEQRRGVGLVGRGHVGEGAGSGLGGVAAAAGADDQGALVDVAGAARDVVGALLERDVEVAGFAGGDASDSATIDGLAVRISNSDFEPESFVMAKLAAPGSMAKVVGVHPVSVSVTARALGASVVPEADDPLEEQAPAVRASPATTATETI